MSLVLEGYEGATPNGYRHVKVFCFDPCATLEDLAEEIERRWPGEKKWRKKPTAYSNRDFERNDESHFLYARFSVRSLP